MPQSPFDLETRVQANDLLLKAVVTLLTSRDPTFIKQIDDVFMVARAHGDEIYNMDAAAWTHIQSELEVARSFALGDEGAETVDRTERARPPILTLV